MKRQKRAKSRHVRADLRGFFNHATWVAWVCLTVTDCVLLAAMIIVSSYVPALRERAWLAAPVTLAILFGGIVPMVQLQALHLNWQVNAAIVRSIQPSRAGHYTREMDNAEFVSVQPCGPFTKVRQRSGRTLLWPRWLRHERTTYVFVLRGDKVALVPLGSMEPESHA